MADFFNTIGRLPSLRRHRYRERHLDELFVLVDSFQGAAYVIGDIGRSALLDPIRKLHDGSFQGELVFVDFEEQGREQV
jgi:hypothetical protein